MPALLTIASEPIVKAFPQLRLVHWCHGAPGFIPLLARAAAAFPDDASAFTEAALQAGEVVWERGLLKKVLPLWVIVHGALPKPVT